MTITKPNTEPHWNYMLALDADLVLLSRYIEFSAANFNCYSIELARVLLAAASEVDVVCKQLCKNIVPTSSADNINRYRDEIRAAFPNLHEFKVLMPRFGLELRPWDQWKEAAGVPLWWTSYNKVKHQRHDMFHQATLENALNAVAGLFVILLHLYKQQVALAELAPPPQLLHVEAKHHGGVNVGGYGVTLAYKI